MGAFLQITPEPVAENILLLLLEELEVVAVGVEQLGPQAVGFGWQGFHFAASWRMPLRLSWFLSASRRLAAQAAAWSEASGRSSRRATATMSKSLAAGWAWDEMKVSARSERAAGLFMEKITRGAFVVFPKLWGTCHRPHTGRRSSCIGAHGRPSRPIRSGG